MFRTNTQNSCLLLTFSLFFLFSFSIFPPFGFPVFPLFLSSLLFPLLPSSLSSSSPACVFSFFFLHCHTSFTRSVCPSHHWSRVRAARVVPVLVKGRLREVCQVCSTKTPIPLESSPQGSRAQGSCLFPELGTTLRTRTEFQLGTLSQW